MLVPSLLATLSLAAVHIFGGKLRFLDVIPRSRVLSAAGGVSVAYVFVHLLPELAAGQRELQAANLIWYSIAMLLHFLVNDYGLRHDHPRAYHRTGRWLLTAAVLGGWRLGVMTEIAEPALATLFAFVAGGVVLNVLKEELPDERQSRFGAFFIGVVAYTALLLMTQ